ncbi:unnamed protein product, partial [Nesidiocoris tenuis]
MIYFTIKEKKIFEFQYRYVSDRDDLVYLSNDDERNEYVLNDVGKVWMGSYKEPKGRRWVFGQFEDVVLPCTILLLELSDLPHEDRGNPILLARAISAVVSIRKDPTVLENRTSGQILRCQVLPEEYESKLVDHSLIKIHAIATVSQTRQTWSEEDDFPLIKPSLDIKDGELKPEQGLPCNKYVLCTSYKNMCCELLTFMLFNTIAYPVAMHTYKHT